MEFTPKHDKPDASTSVPGPRKPPVAIIVPQPRKPADIETA